MQAAARDYIRDRCIQLDQHARSRQEALRSLRSQWQSILDFRKLVVRTTLLLLQVFCLDKTITKCGLWDWGFGGGAVIKPAVFDVSVGSQTRAYQRSD